MRRLIFVSIALIPAVFIGGIRLRGAMQSGPSSQQVKQQNVPPSPLTPEEESDLRNLTQQALARALIWNPKPTNCEESGEITPLVLAEKFKQYEGREIESTLIVEERRLFIFLPALHISLGFMRLHDAGLGPPTVEYFCENSYEEYIAAQKQMADKTQEIGEEITRRAKSDPQIAKIIEEMDKKQAERPISTKERKETRSFKVLTIVEPPRTPIDFWDEEKRRLYERVEEIARKEVENFYCGSGKITTVTVPHFNVGDPSINVLVEPPPSHESNMDETTILWIKFTREPSGAQYDAYLVKAFGLPDQLDYYRPLIKKRQAKQLQILCPKKRHTRG